MTYYIKNNSFCELNGEQDAPNGMTEVDQATYDSHVADVEAAIAQQKQDIANDKLAARDSLVASLVNSTGLTEDQVRAAL